MTKTDSIQTAEIWSLLNEVADPEIPVLTVVDLGIIRDVVVTGDNVEIVLTPTYSGCPAITRMEWDIRIKLKEKGYEHVQITTRLSPAWTTNWMSPSAREKLSAYGIAPPGPVPSVCMPDLFALEEAIQCPHCRSHHTELISKFGSTPCKALYKCLDCREPFDHFKCH